MSDTELKCIGERICKLRKRSGMTQEQLAEKMDVSIQMISNLERGMKAIRIDNLVKLSRILGVTADFILTGQQTTSDLDSLSQKINRLSAEHRDLIELIVTYLSKEAE